MEASQWLQLVYTLEQNDQDIGYSGDPEKIDVSKKLLLETGQTVFYKIEYQRSKGRGEWMALKENTLIVGTG